MNSTEASSSRSPHTLLNRELERIHISKGMLKIRVNVMELGRFTLREVRARPVTSSIILQQQGERNARRGSNRRVFQQFPENGRVLPAVLWNQYLGYFGAAILSAFACLAMIKSLILS